MQRRGFLNCAVSNKGWPAPLLGELRKEKPFLEKGTAQRAPSGHSTVKKLPLAYKKRVGITQDQLPNIPRVSVQGLSMTRTLVTQRRKRYSPSALTAPREHFLVPHLKRQLMKWGGKRVCGAKIVVHLHHRMRRSWVVSERTWRLHEML